MPDLALLVGAEDDRMLGRLEVQAHDLFELSAKSEALLTLNILKRWGLSPRARQMRPMVASLAPVALAMVVRLQ